MSNFIEIFSPRKKKKEKERKREREKKKKRRKEGRKIGRKTILLRLVDRALVLGGIPFLDSA